MENGFWVRLLTSTRFWSALVGILVIVSVQMGLRSEVADRLSTEVMAIVGLLIGSYTVRRAE